MQRFLAITLLIFFGASPIALALEIRLDCMFYYVVTPNKDFSSSLSSKEKFALKFFSKDEKIYVAGNLGEGEVQWLSTPDGTTFLEVTNSGSVQVTAVDSTGRAIHSRHTFIAAKIVPSQYYGICK